MKVKTLLKEIQKRMEEYPDFEEWEVYTEQPDLCVPENFRTIEEEIQVQKEDSEKYDPSPPVAGNAPIQDPELL